MSLKLRQVNICEEQRLVEEESKWSQWQSNMISAYNEALRKDKDFHLGMREKARNWKRLIDGFWRDNPYSTEDNRIRRHAMKRVDDIRSHLVKPGRHSKPPKYKRRHNPYIGDHRR